MMQFLTTILILFLLNTAINYWQSLEASGHGFYGSIATRCFQKQCKKLTKNSWSDQRGGGRTISPRPEYATAGSLISTVCV